LSQDYYSQQTYYYYFKHHGLRPDQNFNLQTQFPCS
jgi:hypothetical protein